MQLQFPSTIFTSYINFSPKAQGIRGKVLRSTEKKKKVVVHFSTHLQNTYIIFLFFLHFSLSSDTSSILENFCAYSCTFSLPAFRPPNLFRPSILVCIWCLMSHKHDQNGGKKKKERRRRKKLQRSDGKFHEEKYQISFIFHET